LAAPEKNPFGHLWRNPLLVPLENILSTPMSALCH